MNTALQTLMDRGFIKACTDYDALSDLMDKEKVTFYVGADPTGRSLHIGHMVPFFAMHHLQKAGHNPIALVGGGTAMIGDPSGRTEMRKMLTPEQVTENCKSIKAQLGTVVDFTEHPQEGMGKAIMLNNADWLTDLNYITFLREIGRHFSVNRMLTFESYKQRLERGLSFIEFNYQLLQSYDFYVLNQEHGCRLQIGGDDQWGNIVSGIELIRRMNGAECYGLTFNLITRSDGHKMGKSEKGAVFLDPELFSAYDFYQYWRNVNDDDVIKFLKLFTFLPLEEIAQYEKADVNINDAKERLAYEQTKIIHGVEEAEKARIAAKTMFKGANLGQEGRDGMPSLAIAASELENGIPVLDLFSRTDLAATNSDARRLVAGGAAWIGETKIEDPKTLIDKTYLDGFGEMILRAGKKRYFRITIA
ncbi:tyrosine--tRNA ligase [Sphaerochaeta globosa]|uniref:Tyrosine--tRNA ligase n=1 Tax=Sphaerochaeta globosa (strain ATCC BAA-1886 / DSM 22777 / Buddy) TaxID=158189 RepID=F0RWZ2_SPHGB|nr:tyrosine--tRNA ligase [Sphaerochaeta globosa]ADY13773.1 Tyrosyl-tRNA synthetase [Sphaerochaeta globosa str. Buddy]